ncbi:hypothetical protein HQ571_00310 [Candidatus Kuenenbacteria bacterium]|nr:hypothetical protein [Candidatus Kuenenbacteria bacterium]
MPKFTQNFKQITKKDVKIAGGKGASLGEMINSGIEVPPGFVVLAGAFERFLAETDLNMEVSSVLKKVNPDDLNSVEKASGAVQDMIYDAIMPEDIANEIAKEFAKLKSTHVAVRSSATAEDSAIASWAGELDSYLNVTKKNLHESVKKCWASLFTPRAIFYRFEKRLHKEKVSVAVVIQKMVQSEVSGITFTVHPVTEDRNQMVIEAGWGLGEAIVGGMITPDMYVLEKCKMKNVKPRSKLKIKKDEGLQIMDKNISEQKMMIVRGAKGTVEKSVPAGKREKQKMTDKQILKLAKVCLDIEKHYKKPQDIEWGIEKNKIYILQSRPITTLGH